MLVDPGELARWWGPSGFTTPRIDSDVRVGGAYRIEMQPPEGERFFLRGEFLSVEPPAELAYTFVWEDPDPDDRENIVRLSLRDLGDATEVSLDQRPFATEARRALHEQGWSDSFDKLQGLLTDRSG